MKFTWIPAIVMIAIFIPNLFSAFFPMVESIKLKQNKMLEIFEQVGRYGSMFLMCVIIEPFGFSFRSSILFLLWLFIMISCILLYWLCWFIYFKQGRHMIDLFCPRIIPVPMAVLPSFVFVSTGLLTLNPLLSSTAIIFAYSHIKISLESYKQCL